jgi:hypothetical protein
MSPSRLIVVALFARLRLVSTNEYARLLDERELEPTKIVEMSGSQGRNVLIGALAAISQLCLIPSGHRISLVMADAVLHTLTDGRTLYTSDWRRTNDLRCDRVWFNR